MKKIAKDYFIPHAGNQYQPHSLQKMAVLGMTVMVLLTFSLANLQSLLWISSHWMVSTILPAVIVDLTNEERGGSELPPLKRSELLDQAATLKAKHMAEYQYFSHYSPEGVSPWHWFSQADYKFVSAGENLAIHFTDSEKVVEAWMNSPTHKANIVSGDYTEIGVGAVAGEYQGFKTVYVVQLFGTPAAVSSDLAVAEVSPEPTVLSEVAQAEPVAVINTNDETSDTQQIAGSDERILVTEDNVTVSLSTDRDPVELSGADVVEDATISTEVIDQSEVVYSDFVSTTTGGVPASISPNKPESSVPSYLAVATQPQTVLQVMYILIGLFVLGALLLSILIEIKRQNPVQIAYGVGLMAVMTTLFYIHSYISGSGLVA